jgi:transposase InsO family protein
MSSSIGTESSNAEVLSFLEAAALEPKRTSVRAPWQNGIAERWIGSCRREILDHIIDLNEGHLRRVLRDYVNYYEQDRLHDSLQKDAPNRRAVEQQPGTKAIVVASAAGWAAALLCVATSCVGG